MAVITITCQALQLPSLVGVAIAIRAMHLGTIDIKEYDFKRLLRLYVNSGSKRFQTSLLSLYNSTFKNVKLRWDFRPNAKWIRRIWSAERWKEEVCNPSWIFRIVGVTILSNYPDWMHCKHLGTDKPLIGCHSDGYMNGSLIYIGAKSFQVFRQGQHILERGWAI